MKRSHLAAPGHAFDPRARLQTKAGICVYLGHISPATYDTWFVRGLVPGPVEGTSRYDVRQHDIVLDARARISPHQRLSPLDEWEAANAN